MTSYNYRVGTQTFAPTYGFTGKTRLVESAEAILEMGSNILKIGLHKSRPKPDGPEAFTFYNLPDATRYRTLRQAVDEEPSIRAVLHMPFDHYLFWAYPFALCGICTQSYWYDGITPEERESEYREIYELTRYLLTEFAGSGKTFYIGHWEGDWTLLGHTDAMKPVAPEHVGHMIDWLNLRQQAVDDAKRDTPAENVRVFHYVEVNRVIKEMRTGKLCMTEAVLPHIAPDFVSYSAYDACYDSQTGAVLSPEAMREALQESLGLIEKHLVKKPGLEGKRVFIGEYGFPLSVVKTPQAQLEATRSAMRAALEWGCPFMLYWQMYDNEAEEGGINARGFWLINNKGEKQPTYELHRKFVESAKKFVVEYERKNGQSPSAETFRQAALEWV